MTAKPQPPIRPAIPTPPEKPHEPGVPGRGSLLPIALVAALGLACLVTLSIMSGGFFALVVAVAMAIFTMIAFHYLLWGWWLGEAIRRKQAEEEAQD